jgi:hypothetical protein
MVVSEVTRGMVTSALACRADYRCRSCGRSYCLRLCLAAMNARLPK